MASRCKRANASSLTALINKELQPTTLQAWRKLHMNKKFRVRYENGEEEVLDSKRLEPDGDFIPLEVQSTVCSKVKGGRYRATVLEIVESNNCSEQPVKRKVKPTDVNKIAAKKARTDVNTLKQLQLQQEIQRQLEYVDSTASSDNVVLGSTPADHMPGEYPAQPEATFSNDALSMMSRMFKEELTHQLQPIMDSIIDIQHQLEVVTDAVSYRDDAVGDKLTRLIKKSQDMLQNPDTTPCKESSPPASPSPTLSFQQTATPPRHFQKTTKPLQKTATPPQSFQKTTPSSDISKGHEITACVSHEEEGGPDEIEEVLIPDTPTHTPHGPKPAPVEYVEIGKVKVNTAKIASAKKAPNAFKMARKLLPEFFTPEELCTCTCVPPKPGKSKRSQADPQKLGLLLGEVRKVYPGGWDSGEMLSRLNQGFIDYRNKHKS